MIVIERSIWIDASRERVWQAITDAGMLTAWYAPGCPWEIDALRVVDNQLILGRWHTELY